MSEVAKIISIKCETTGWRGFLHHNMSKKFNRTSHFYDIIPTEYFNYLGSMIINDERCTRDIKSRIAVVKAAFNRKKIYFTSKLDLKYRTELVKATSGV
jgi:hypothetical protein